jgi:hypothetical protein
VSSYLKLLLINKLNLYYLPFNSHAVIILLNLYPYFIHKTLLLERHKKLINRLGLIFISNHFPHRIIVLAGKNNYIKFLYLKHSPTLEIWDNSLLIFMSYLKKSLLLIKSLLMTRKRERINKKEVNIVIAFNN